MRLDSNACDVDHQISTHEHEKETLSLMHVYDISNNADATGTYPSGKPKQMMK